MSRRALPARLWLRPEERDADGRLLRRAQWVIKHGTRRIGTGCGAGERRAAEAALADYIVAAHRPERLQRDAARVPLADVIALYLADVVERIPDAAQRRRAADRAGRLLAHFGHATLDAVTGASCRAFAAGRGQGGARRDLQDLSAAIQHHHREGLHREAIRVWLPPRGTRRERFLTRDEIARLVWTCWRGREMQRRDRTGDAAAPRLPTAKRPWRHLARAILFAYYTGSRPGDALRASYLDGPGRSVVDLDRAVYHRLPRGKTATRKRQPPVRLGRRILAHLARWRASSVSGYVVEWEGAAVASVKVALARAVAAAGLPPDVTLYTLRHSRATQLMQDGHDEWQVAGALGTSSAMIRESYGHHAPEFQGRVANAR